jgi:Flp pilus assembly protein TadD
MTRQEEKLRRMREDRTKSVPLPASEPIKTDWLGKIRIAVLDVIFLVVVVLCIYAAGREWYLKEITIDSLNVPEELAKSGYTGAVVAAKLVDEAYNIGLRIQEQSKTNTWHKDAEIANDTIPSAEIADIVLPNLSWSFHAALRFFLEELGVTLPRIGGEITLYGDTTTLTLRKLGDHKRIPSQTASGKVADIDGILREGGSALLLLTNPKVALINAYYRFDTDTKQPGAAGAALENLARLAEYAIKYPPTKDESLAYRLWGIALSDQKRYGAAIEKYDKAAKADPKDPAPHHSWGNALLNLQHPIKAIEQYRKAIEIDPKFVRAYYGWGNVLLILNRPEEAIEQYRKAVEIEPQDAFAYLKLGNAFLASESPIDAIANYRKSIELDPMLYYAYYNWGNALFALQSMEKAIEQYRNAVKINPNFAKPYLSWGLALEQLNRDKEAEEQFKKYKELNR